MLIVVMVGRGMCLPVIILLKTHYFAAHVNVGQSWQVEGYVYYAKD